MSPKKTEQSPAELVEAAVGRPVTKKPATKAAAPKVEAKKTIRMRQIGSGIACPVEMRETLKALGLGKMNRISERPDTKEVRGMIKKIPHLVEVVE